ncbi:Dps family protein [Parvularcula oceani]|uniref:Dps family protein n=1 Tax=Parvularcula oceani TaxID=1247963 RepID=UPI00069155E0|nr:DNA starvation/stationary phase protection protein [Parvularcula oceani]
MRNALIIAGTSLCLALPAAAQDMPNAYADDAAASAVPLEEGVRGTSSEALQDTLYELIALKHMTHQSHWNVTGPLFYSLHDLLGEAYTGLGGYIDQVAERKRALGAPADGRPAAVAQNAALPGFPEGLLADDEVLDLLLTRYETVSERLQQRIGETSDDPVTQDLLIDVARTIEKDLWMIRSFQL